MNFFGKSGRALVVLLLFSAVASAGHVTTTAVLVNREKPEAKDIVERFKSKNGDVGSDELRTYAAFEVWRKAAKTVPTYRLAEGPIEFEYGGRMLRIDNGNVSFVTPSPKPSITPAQVDVVSPSATPSPKPSAEPSSLPAGVPSASPARVQEIAHASAAPIALGRRVALVMGNAAYRSMPSLANPKNDAADVAAALKGLGFETIVATDLNKTAMNEVLGRFSTAVRGADVAIVYYSGHGMQFEGKNYLLPVDANLETAADVNRFQLTAMDDLIDVLSAANGMQLIVLDACRNNAVERDFKNRIASAPGGNRDVAATRGFTRIDPRNGLIVAYSTASGKVAADGNGRNSPFTEAFLKNVSTPDTDVRQMLFQVQSDVFNATHTQLPEISSLYVGPSIRLKVSANKP